MKVKISILCLLLWSFSFSQNNFSEHVKWGVTGNFHRGSIVNVHDRSEGRYGAGVGVFADISLMENDAFDTAWLYVSPQIEYSMQGEHANAETDTYGVQKYHYDYLAAAVYLKYFFHNGRMKSGAYLFGGPRVEFMVSQKEDVSAAYDAVYYQYNLDDVVNKTGFGASFGAGFKINKQLEAFIRYDQGFSKVYENNPRNTHDRLLAVGVNFFINTNWRSTPRTFNR